MPNDSLIKIFDDKITADLFGRLGHVAFVGDIQKFLILIGKESNSQNSAFSRKTIVFICTINLI